jgi:hypothetical protein
MTFTAGPRTYKNPSYSNNREAANMIGQPEEQTHSLSLGLVAVLFRGII